MRKLIPAALVTALLLAAAPSAFAADPPAAEKPAIDVAWSIPDSPAASALGVARSDANPPSIMETMNFEVLNGDDATGYAGEVSPYLLYRGWLHQSPTDPGRLLTIDHYQTDGTTRFWAGLSVSGGFVRADENNSRAALGVRWTLFNAGDPYARHGSGDVYENVALYNAAERGPGNHPTGCLYQAILATPDEAPDTVTPGAADSTTTIEHPDRAKKFQDCIKAFQSATWNATSVQVAAVQLWNTTTGGFSDLAPSGQRYSAVVSYGFEHFDQRILRRNSQLLASVARGENVLVKNAAGAMVRRDETTVGVRVRFAPDVYAIDLSSDPREAEHSRQPNGRDFNIFGEASWSRHDYAGLPREEEWAYTFGAEWQFRENLWLAVSSQRRSSDRVTGDDTVTGVQLRFAFNDKASFSR